MYKNLLAQASCLLPSSACIVFIFVLLFEHTYVIAWFIFKILNFKSHPPFSNSSRTIHLFSNIPNSFFSPKNVERRNGMCMQCTTHNSSMYSECHSSPCNVFCADLTPGLVSTQQGNLAGKLLKYDQSPWFLIVTQI